MCRCGALPPPFWVPQTVGLSPSRLQSPFACARSHRAHARMWCGVSELECAVCVTDVGLGGGYRRISSKCDGLQHGMAGLLSTRCCVTR